MDAEELRRRTKKFGLEVIRLVESLPSNQTSKVIGNQLLRFGIVSRGKLPCSLPWAFKGRFYLKSWHHHRGS